MKGVILAGGTGSRLKPLTNYINKHLLQIGPYPMLYWSIIKLKEAGISEMIVVTNQSDFASFVELIGTGEELHVKIHYRIQDNKGGGIADALLSTRNFFNKEKFVVLLGDNIFEDSLLPYVEMFKKQKEGARILLKEVDDPTRYGVPLLDVRKNTIQSIVEKPLNPPSPYCVTGIYMYDDDVFPLIEQINPSERNELEITDVNNLYIKREQLYFDVLKGWWIDAGTHESLQKARELINQNIFLGEFF
jgi:glucose-1-phosphate thymidylyltransferase